MKSQRFQLNAYDWLGAGRMLLMLLAGTSATFLADQIPNLDFGQYTVLVVAVFSFVIDLLRRFAAGPVVEAESGEPDSGGGK